MSTEAGGISIEQLCRLPMERRLAILEALWERMDVELGPKPVPDDVVEEAVRKYEAYFADPSPSVPWEQVRAEIRRSLGADDVHLAPGEQAEIDRRIAEHEARAQRGT
jgi:putative addiction module component (TIGR02574 family)